LEVDPCTPRFARIFSGVRTNQTTGRVDTMSVGEINLDVQGRVGGEVKFKTSTSGIAMASFRLAATPRYYNRAEGGWTDRPTTWFTVECWRGLAENVQASLSVGQPVLVTGRLKTTEWLDNTGENHSRTVLDAFSVGHDLSRGTAQFRKNPPKVAQQADSLRDEMRELVDDVESEEPNPFHFDDNGELTGPFASGPLVADGAAFGAGPTERPGGGSGGDDGGADEDAELATVSGSAKAA
jgi:single-strand DNA-binding protein